MAMDGNTEKESASAREVTQWCFPLSNLLSFLISQLLLFTIMSCRYNGLLVAVRTSAGLGRQVQHWIVSTEVGKGPLNAVKTEFQFTL